MSSADRQAHHKMNHSLARRRHVLLKQFYRSAIASSIGDSEQVRLELER
jgi:hypothetical protein